MKTPLPFFVTMLLVLASHAGFASAPSWSRTFGGTSRDSFFQTIERANGHLLAVGKTESVDGDLTGASRFGGTDAWIVETDAQGRLVRQLVVGGSGEDQFNNVASTVDGGFVVWGSTDSRDGDLIARGAQGGEHFDLWFRRYDSNFQLRSEKFFGGSSDDFGVSLIALQNGDWLVGSDSESTDGSVLLAPIGQRHRGNPGGHRDYLIMRLSSEGEIRWVRSYGGTNHEYLSQLVELPDGSLAAYGRTESFDKDVQGFRGEYDGWLLKLTATGDLEWSRTVGGEMWDWGSNVVVTPDGGLLTSSYFFSWDADAEGNHGDYDYGLVRFNAKGERLWSRMFGGRVDDFAQGAAVLPDGTYLIAGGSVSEDQDVAENRGSFDLWLARIDDQGHLISSRSYGGSAYDISSPGGSDYDRAGPGHGVQVLKDGGVVVTGSSRSSDGDVGPGQGGYDAWILRLGVNDLNATGVQKRGNWKPLAPKPVVSEVAPESAPDLEWTKLYGGAEKDAPLDAAQAVVEMPDGGFAFVASTQSRDPLYEKREGSDVWVVRTKPNGQILWKKRFGGSQTDTGAALAVTPDGGLVVTATTDSRDGDVKKALGHMDIWVFRLSSSGTLKWSRTLGGSSQDQAWSVALTPDADVLVGGLTFSEDGDVRDHLGGQDFWIARLNLETGATMWTRSLGGPSNDYLTQVTATPDGDIVAVGRTESSKGHAEGNHGMYDYLLIRLSPQGVVRWSKTYGGRDWDWGNSVAVTKDGGFIVSGYTYTFDDFERGQVKCNHGEMDYWLARLDPQGELLWQQCLGGPNYELGYGVIETRDGGFVVAGGSASKAGQVLDSRGGWDAWVVKLNASGELRWQKSVGGSGYDVGYGVIETRDGGLLMIGESFSNDGDFRGLHGEEDVFLAKIKPDRN